MSLRLLWVKAGTLLPLDTGGKKRSYSMLCELSRKHEVTYLGLDLGRSESVSSEEMEAPYAHEKIWIPLKTGSKNNSLGFATSLAKNFFASTYPYAIARYRCRALDQKIKSLCQPDRFDLVVCDFLVPAPSFRGFGERGCPIPSVLFQHNMEARIWERLARGKKNPLERFYFRSQWKRMARWEKHLSKLFSGIVTVSPEDSAYAREVYGLDNILGDVPTGVSSDYFSKVSAEGDGKTVGFLGSMDWMPNIEAVHWFAEAIMPEIRRSIPDFRLIVIGRNPPSSIVQLGGTIPGIEVTGTVDDIRPSLCRCDALVVPLLSGGGTRIKIMESIAAGVPVVSTTVGAEGLGLKSGIHIAIADTPPEFARTVCELLGDVQKRNQMADEGRALVRAEHSWESVTAQFLELCNRILRPRTKGRDGFSIQL